MDTLQTNTLEQIVHPKPSLLEEDVGLLALNFYGTSC